MQKEYDDFQVGDTVWCLVHGKGKVYEVNSSNEPVSVYFDSGRLGSYTSDGYFLKGCNRTLFFSEPKIEASVIRPFVPTLVGKRVVVKEPACYDVCIKIEFENKETFGGDGYSFRKSFVEVYEVSSENLLKK